MGDIKNILESINKTKRELEDKKEIDELRATGTTIYARKPVEDGKWRENKDPEKLKEFLREWEERQEKVIDAIKADVKLWGETADISSRSYIGYIQGIQNQIQRHLSEGQMERLIDKYDINGFK